MRYRIGLFLALALIIGFAGCDTNPTESNNNGNVVDLFPTPVTDASSLFEGVDDSFLEVTFTAGFTFSLYGTTYSSVFLNTNGGMTFGTGESDYDVAAADVTFPGIAVFWGDMDASEHGAETRANQMRYQQFADRFVVTYVDFQDNDDETWNNTATVTLYANGKIVIVYGEVLSADILIGIWDGTHTDDRSSTSTTINSYATALGTGVLLYDYWGSEATGYTGTYNNQTVTFNP